MNERALLGADGYGCFVPGWRGKGSVHGALLEIGLVECMRTRQWWRRMGQQWVCGGGDAGHVQALYTAIGIGGLEGGNGRKGTGGRSAGNRWECGGGGGGGQDWGGSS